MQLKLNISLFSFLQWEGFRKKCVLLRRLWFFTGWNISQKNPFCLMLKTIFKKLLYCCEVFKLFPKGTIYVILQLTIFFDIQWPKFWILFAWTSNVDPMLRLLQVEMVGGFVRVDDDKRSSLMCKLEWTQIIVIPCWFAFYFLFRYANLT